MGSEYDLESQERRREHGKHKPDVEVEQEISNVESPWFRPKNVWPFPLSPENIVGDDVPRHNNKLLKEDIINCDLSCL